MLLCLALLTTVGTASTDREVQQGPGAAEFQLSELVHKIAVRTLDPDESRTLVADAVARSLPPDGDLARAILLLKGTLEGAPMLPDLPRDHGLLFVLARHLPTPTPSAWAGPLAARVVGGDTRRGQAIVELLGKLPLKGRSEVLLPIFQSSRRGELEPDIGSTVALELARCATLEHAPALLEAAYAPDLSSRHFAGLALQHLQQRHLRRQPEALMRWFEARADRYGETIRAPLDALKVCLTEGGEGRTVRALVERLTAGGSPPLDSSAILANGSALIGRALAEWQEAPAAEDTWGSTLAAAGDLPREPYRKERPLIDLPVRARLVHLLLQSLGGRDVRAALQELVLEAAVESDRNPLDDAFFGFLGPFDLLRPLRREGHGAGTLRFLLVLCEEIEASKLLTGQGLVDLPEGWDEWMASWIFVTAARLLLEDAGDPEAALRLLEPRLRSLEGMHLDRNLRLFIEGKLLEARVHLYRWDGAAAHRALDAAQRVAGGLRTDAEDSLQLELARGNVPRPPPELALWRYQGYLPSASARIHWLRGSVLATLEENATAAAEEYYLAGDLHPFDGQRWQLVALDQARRGLREAARRSLGCVEKSPDALYDLACVEGLLGHADVALELLREHLEQNTYTPEGRIQEIEFMTRDPDLRPIHSHPGFPPGR